MNSVRATSADIIRWATCYSGSAAERIGSVGTWYIASPCEVAVAVIERIGQLQRHPGAVIKPCDLHAFGIGEPADPWATKFGGVPYRPAEAPWPQADDGTPYIFMCQFNFTESLDLLRPLPGDVLLVFEKNGTFGADVERQVIFEWHSVGIRDIETSRRCAYVDDQEFVGYGVPCRTFDFLDIEPIIAESKESVEAARTESEILPAPLTWNAARFLGMKIGGFPCWQDHGPWHAYSPRWGNCHSAEPQTVKSYLYLGGFGDIGPMIDHAWPWINRATPVSLREASTELGGFGLYDGFYIHLFLDRDDEIQWVLDFT